MDSRLLAAVWVLYQLRPARFLAWLWAWDPHFQDLSAAHSRVLYSPARSHGVRDRESFSPRHPHDRGLVLRRRREGRRWRELLGRADHAGPRSSRFRTTRQ